MFRPNDKIICIDDNSIPTKSRPGMIFDDFSLFGGSIEKGKIYCVNYVRFRADGRVAIGIVGKPVIEGSKQIYWNSARFRRVSPRESERPHMPQINISELLKQKMEPYEAVARWNM